MKLSPNLFFRSVKDIKRCLVPNSLRNLLRLKPAVTQSNLVISKVIQLSRERRHETQLSFSRHASPQYPRASFHYFKAAYITRRPAEATLLLTSSAVRVLVGVSHSNETVLSYSTTNLCSVAWTTGRHMTTSVTGTAAAAGGNPPQIRVNYVQLLVLKGLFFPLGLRCHAADDALKVITCGRMMDRRSTRCGATLKLAGPVIFTAAYITLTTVIYLSTRGKLNVRVDTCLPLGAGSERRPPAASATLKKSQVQQRQAEPEVALSFVRALGCRRRGSRWWAAFCERSHRTLPCLIN